MHFLGLSCALAMAVTVSCMNEIEWRFALEKSYIDFNEARVSRNATLVAKFFSHDAKILGDGKNIVAGRAEIESMLTRHFDGDMRIILKFERLVVWNDLGALVEDSAVTLNPEHGDRILDHTRRELEKGTVTPSDLSRTNGVRVFVWEDGMPKISMSIFNSEANEPQPSSKNSD